jgi:predicted RNA-binding Zn ribbon-like protein
MEEGSTLNAMTTLPPWVPAVEDKPAPMPLLLVQSFVNTVDRDRGTDEFGRDDDARAWLSQAGLLGAERTDLDLARDLRESVRGLIGRESLTATQRGPLDQLLAGPGPAVTVGADGTVSLGAPGLVRLLVIIRDAQADGTWDRLRLCANPDCRWAFYDRSHARRGQWCDMTTCGNRIKNRNLRARQRA